MMSDAYIPSSRGSYSVPERCPTCGSERLVVDVLFEAKQVRYRCLDCSDNYALAKNENLKSKYNGRFIKWAHNVKARCPACAICGTTKFLMAHHIIPKKYLFEGVEKGLFSREYADSLLYNPGNGVTLCVNCHKMAHEGLNIIKKWNVPDGGDRDE